MANKLEKEEIEKLKEHESKKNQILYEIGALSVQGKKLHKEFETLEMDMQNYRKIIVDKYGKIVVDLNDGSFTEES